MVFSKSILDNTLAYLKAGLEAKLLLIEAQYSVTITRLKHFETYNKENNSTPFGVLFEDDTTFDMETLQREINKINFTINFVDDRLDLTLLRNNLYAYRDAMVELINSDPTLGNTCLQAYLTRVQPPIVLHTSTNYNGVIQIQFTVEAI